MRSTVEDSNLVAHAKRELSLAGLYDKDSDYDGMIGEAVEELIKLFASQGHSGFSASMVTDIAQRLMRFEPLTPVTNDPDDWMEVFEGQFQCRRHSSLFSEDAGRTYYDMDERLTRRRRVANFLLRRKGWGGYPRHTAQEGSA